MSGGSTSESGLFWSSVSESEDEEEAVLADRRSWERRCRWIRLCSEACSTKLNVCLSVCRNTIPRVDPPFKIKLNIRCYQISIVLSKWLQRCLASLHNFQIHHSKTQSVHKHRNINQVSKEIIYYVCVYIFSSSLKWFT